MRLLICAQEPLGDQMAGPAIRATELANVLGAELLQIDGHDPAPLRRALRGVDAVITPPLWPRLAAALGDTPWICDLYAPEPLETLEHFRDRPALRRLMCALAVDRLETALERASLLLCASDRQRDLYTGALLAARGLSPDAYDADPALERVLVVPFGIPEDPPRPDGTHPIRDGLGVGDAPVVLWNGGVWPWLDPQAAIEATLAHPRAHIVFMGGGAVTAGPRVHVNRDWVPYPDRGAWLLDADAVISAHREHLESRFAFRTRLVDALWARRPIVCTPGDDLADLVARQALGGDLSQLAQVLETDCGDRLDAVAGRFTWSAVARPLERALERPLGRPGRHRSPHPARAARTALYRAARPALDRTGLRDWPRAA